MAPSMHEHTHRAQSTEQTNLQEKWKKYLTVTKTKVERDGDNETNESLLKAKTGNMTTRMYCVWHSDL